MSITDYYIYSKYYQLKVRYLMIKPYSIIYIIVIWLYNVMIIYIYIYIYIYINIYIYILDIGYILKSKFYESIKYLIIFYIY